MRQPIAAAWHGYNVAIAVAALVQCLAQRRDVDVQVVFGDRTSRPQSRHQFVFADHGAFCRCEQAEDVERAPTELYRFAIMQQAPSLKIEPKATEADVLGIIRKLHQIASDFRT